VTVTEKDSIMSFGHKKLDVYRLSLKYVKWVYDLSGSLTGKNRFARDQLLRASQSIPLNIAEGNGKLSESDKMRFYGIARGSALECAAIQDVLQVCNLIEDNQNRIGEEMLIRIVSMLTKMTQRSWSVREEEAQYGDTAKITFE